MILCSTVPYKAGNIGPREHRDDPNENSTVRVVRVDKKPEGCGPWAADLGDNYLYVYVYLFHSHIVSHCQWHILTKNIIWFKLLILARFYLSFSLSAKLSYVDWLVPVVASYLAYRHKNSIDFLSSCQENKLIWFLKYSSITLQVHHVRSGHLLQTKRGSNC